MGDGGEGFLWGYCGSGGVQGVVKVEEMQACLFQLNMHGRMVLQELLSVCAIQISSQA